MADYTIDTSHNAWNFTPADQVSAVPGFAPYAPREVLFGTVHYWGDPAPTFEEVISFFCDGPGKGTSAHAVLEAGRVSWIVSPDDISWACGNAYGNVKSISIECNPRASDADYQTLAEEWARLWGIYGKFPLVPHSKWTATSCPGPWDVARVEQMATDIFNGVAPSNGANEMAFGPTDKVFVSKDGSQVSLQDILNSIDTKVSTLSPQDLVNIYQAVARIDAVAAILKERINTSNRADGTPFLIACQGDIDAVLADLKAIPAASGSALTDKDKQDISDKVLAELKTQWTK